MYDLVPYPMATLFASCWATAVLAFIVREALRHIIILPALRKSGYKRPGDWTRREIPDIEAKENKRLCDENGWPPTWFDLDRALVVLVYVCAAGYFAAAIGTVVSFFIRR